MLLQHSQTCSSDRLAAELKFGKSLRDRAFREDDVSFDSEFDFECRDWCESLAFAINFAFDGEARSFLSTLGHGHYGSGHTADGFCDWERPWSTAAERIQALTLHIRLLEKWLGKLHDKFRDENDAIYTILDHLNTNGGTSARHAVQLACELETPVFNWLLNVLKSDKFIVVQDSEIRLTDHGLRHHKQTPPTRVDTSQTPTPPTRFELAYKFATLWFGDPKTRFAKFFAVAGVALIAAPWWQPIIQEVAVRYLEVPSDFLEQADRGMFWSGWGLIAIAVSLYCWLKRDSTSRIHSAV